MYIDSYLFYRILCYAVWEECDRLYERRCELRRKLWTLLWECTEWDRV
jgi:hypothetical protein